MAKRSLELRRLSGLVALLCLLAGDPAYAARPSAGARPAPVPPRRGLAGPVGCDATRLDMQKQLTRLLGLPAPQAGESLSLKEERTKKRILHVNCNVNKEAPANKQQGRACERSYLHIIDIAVGADEKATEGCSILKDAGEKAKACKKDEASCFKATAALFEIAEKRLLEASKLLEQGAKELRELKSSNRVVAMKYAGHLSLLAVRIRRLAAQGKVLTLDDPELEKLLGSSTQSAEGVEVRHLLGMYGINKLDPELLEAKSAAIRRELERTDTAAPDQQTTGIYAFQQLRAAHSADAAIELSNQEARRLAATTSQVQQERNRLLSLGAGFNSVAEQRPAAPRRELAANTPAAQEPRLDPGTKRESQPFNISSASMIPALGATGKPPAAVSPPRPRALPSPSAADQQAPTARNLFPAFASRPASRALPLAFRKTSPEGNGHEEAVQPSQREEADSGPGAGALYPTREVSRLEDSRPNPPPVQSQESARPLSTPGAAPADAPMDSGELHAGHGPEGAAVHVPPGQHPGEEELLRAERVAEARLNDFSRGKVLSTSVRDRLRRALALAELRERQAGRSPASLTPGGDGAVAVKSLIHQMAEDGSLRAAGFEMEESDTEREVKRILATLPDEGSAIDILGSHTASLFDRIRNAYGRMAPGKLIHQ